MARQHRVGAASPAGCSRSRAASSRLPTAGSTDRNSTRAPAGTRPNSVPRCRNCWRRPRRRPRSTARSSRARGAAGGPGALAGAGCLDRRDAARPARDGRRRHTSPSSTATSASRSTSSGARSIAYAARLWSLGVRPGDVVAWQLPNWWEAVVLGWAIWRCGAIASPITPSLRAHEVGFILRQTGAHVVAIPHEFRGTDYRALLHDAGFDGAVIAVRDGASASAPPAPDGRGRRRRPRRRAVDFGNDRRSEGRRAHAPNAAARGRQHRRRARDARRPKRCCSRCRSPTSPGLTYGLLLPVTSGDHRGAHGHLGSGRRARARRR